MRLAGFILNKNNKLYSDDLGLISFIQKIKNEFIIDKIKLYVILLSNLSDDYRDELLSKVNNNVVFVNVEGFPLDDYLPKVLLNVIIKLLKDVKEESEYIVFSADNIFTEIAPFIAGYLNYGIVANIINLYLKEGEKFFEIFSYGSKSITSFKKLQDNIVLTVKSSYFNDNVIKNDFKEEVKEELMNIKYEEFFNVGIKLLNKKVSKEETLKLEDARVIVSGGRGLGSKEGFELIKDLARELNGAVGASRAAVDSGWIDPNFQVGQTGKTVAPDLYIAVGISGASQHIAGITRSKVIVAVNTDKEAPIFKYSHLGIVEDYKKFIPAFINELKNNK